MSVSFEADHQARQITIAVVGHLDFRVLTEFRRAYHAIENPQTVIVDLQ